MCSPHISTLFNLNITLCDSFAQRFPSFAPPPPLPLYFDNFELIKLIIFSMSLFVLRCLTNRSVSSFCVLFSPLRLLKTGLDNLRRNKGNKRSKLRRDLASYVPIPNLVVLFTVPKQAIAIGFSFFPRPLKSSSSHCSGNLNPCYLLTQIRFEVFKLF